MKEIEKQNNFFIFLLKKSILLFVSYGVLFIFLWIIFLKFKVLNFPLIFLLWLLVSLSSYFVFFMSALFKEKGLFFLMGMFLGCGLFRIFLLLLTMMVVYFLKKEFFKEYTLVMLGAFLSVWFFEIISVLRLDQKQVKKGLEFNE